MPDNEVDGELDEVVVYWPDEFTVQVDTMDCHVIEREPDDPPVDPDNCIVIHLQEEEE